MDFRTLEEAHQTWQEIRVIGRTIERKGKKYHMVGMTLADEAKLYILEPYEESEHGRRRRKGIRNHRRILKEQGNPDVCYLHCSDIYLGKERLQVQGGSSGPLMDSFLDYGNVQLFLAMMSAGWVVPEWLKHMAWERLQLVTLEIADRQTLPNVSEKTPVTIRHRPDPIQHILEKTITLTVGKSRSFRFLDHSGDSVACYINRVTLIDVWNELEEQFNHPRYTEGLSPEQLRQVKRSCFEALEQSCPKGMCYVGIEYECSKDMSLQFYSKEYLKSRPEEHRGSFASLGMRLKPDRATGTHGLPLRGSVIETAVPPDTVKIPAELFFAFEKVEEWEEQV